MAPRPAVVINPHARQLRERPHLLDALRDTARGHADVYVTGSEAHLTEACRRIRESAATTVVLCGGDGTFMLGATALVAACPKGNLPTVTLAPAGTVATVARGWGQRLGALATLRAVVHGDPPRSLRLRPSLHVSEDTGRTRVAFTIGTGLVARFFERYEAAGAGGLGTALRLTARIFASSLVNGAHARSVLEPLPCRLDVDAVQLVPHAFSLVVCSVLRDLGIGTHVTYRGGEDPLRPHLVASALPTRALGAQWPRVLLGRPLKGAHGYDGLVQSFGLDFGESLGPYVLDGDSFTARRLVVRAGPQLMIAAY